jgi:hypothetical protein
MLEENLPSGSIQLPVGNVILHREAGHRRQISKSFLHRPFAGGVNGFPDRVAGGKNRSPAAQAACADKTAAC